MGAALKYLEEKHGLKVSRMTIYNWADKGKRGVTLKTTTKAGRRLTTRSDVDAFVAALG